jgi:5'-nucleotidase
MQKSMISVATALLIFGLSSCDSSSTSSTSVVGAATDDYIIGGDVTLYRMSGEKLQTNCITQDYGLFSCEVPNIAEDEKLLIVVSGGEIDNDGNASTVDDQTAFNGSLSALSSADQGVIVSPLTSTVIAQNLGESVVVDRDHNLSYIDGRFTLTKEEATLLSQNSTNILHTQNNLPTLHMLQKKDTKSIQNQARRVTELLDANISIVESININEEQFRLQILHINDTHSHLEPIRISIYPDGEKTYVYAGGYAKIAKFIKDKKGEDSHAIALHAGDSVQGTLYYTLFDGKADIEALNGMDLDAMTIGNHEFDKGADNFATYFAKEANFAIISDDINVQNNLELKDIIKPYIIKEIDGRKFAIVGDSIDSSVISNPGPTIEFSNYLTSAQNSVALLEEKGINKIIFLTHLGYDTDKILAENVPDIDVIVGGHSHTLLGDFSNLGLNSQGPYPTVISHKNSQTLVVSSWKWGEVIGDLNVVFNEEGVISNYNGTPIMLVDNRFLRQDANGSKVEVNATVKNRLENLFNTMPDIQLEAADSRVAATIANYKPQVDDLMSATIAEAITDLINVRLPGTTDAESGIILAHGSMIAPHAALAMYDKAEEVGGCDFALQNAGGVRITVPKGNITIGEVYTLLPFGNTLVTMDMNGAKIRTMLENAIDRSLITQKDTGSFPYLAGAKITIKKDNKKGNRIVKFVIKESDGNWIDFDDIKTYKIATNFYVASGGDYYSEMIDAKNKVDTGYVDAEIFMEYAQTKERLNKFSDDEVPVTVE